MNHSRSQHSARRFFEAICDHPRSAISAGILLFALLASALPSLQKDTRSDAFIPANHEAHRLGARGRELFGLGDPIVVAIISDEPEGVFTPTTLQLIADLSQALEGVHNIDPEGITSLATENWIGGNQEGMEVEPFLEPTPDTLETAQGVKHAVMAMPVYRGSLVAEDGSGTLIIAELLDIQQAQQSYEATLDLLDTFKTDPNISLHVAGEAALSGYFGAYIDADAKRLVPASALLIVALCYLAFGTLRATLIPAVVVLATAASALGFMALIGVKFFIISNALPVVLIGIAVADSIHILSEYYERAARQPELDSRALTVATMCGIWRPITLTTLTTMAGFFGLAVASIMPPMKYFGAIALSGVALAWLYSLVVVPAILSLLKPQRSPAYKPAIDSDDRSVSTDHYGRAVAALGRYALTHPRAMLTLALCMVVAGIHGGSKIEVDESLLRAFAKDEPIVVAHDAVNGAFHGTYFLDVLIETGTTEALFDPQLLSRIEALQHHALAHPSVNGASSIVDYLKQMNRAMHADAPEAYRLPSSTELAAQYFLLYSATANPTDFEHIVDYDYRLANLRLHLDQGNFQTIAPVINYLQTFLDEHFNDGEISAHITGRAHINYSWMKSLVGGHFTGIAVTLSLVFAMAALSFRSIVAGLFCLSPIVTTVLGMYAFMGYFGIDLSVSSAMFAAIAIGLGVDFCIHTLERLQVLITNAAEPDDATLASLFPATGRALLFNFLTLAGGFGILSISKISILQEFGLSVALCVGLGFAASLSLLPALAKLCKPRFLGYSGGGQTPNQVPLESRQE